MKECKECGKQTTNSKFCSRSCAATFNNKGNNRWKHHSTKSKTKSMICFVCDKHYYGQNKKFCSNECRNIHRYKIIQAGEGSARSVRKYLLEKSNKCEICGISNWNGKELILEMDHIDGDSKNNDIKNCRLLCPNCHSQTDTFRAKNYGKSSRKRVQYY